MAKADQIPMHPDNKLLAFDRAEEYLRQGKVITIFPEARLNPERQLIRSGTGAVHLSLITGAPIIPIGFYVRAQCLRYIGRQKKDRISKGYWQTHGHCYLHTGPPWKPGEDTVQQEESAKRRELTRKLMEMIEAQAVLARQDCTRESGMPVDGRTNDSQS
jgi:1-acyl-sn-glycerol-3-phosphate acyltransferase